MTIPIDNRILSPLFAPFIIIFLYIIFKIYQNYNYQPILRNIIQGYCILFAAIYLITGLGRAFNAQKDGQMYGSIHWKKSDLLENINTIGSKMIYSNACDVIYIITGKSCYELPAKYDRTNYKKNHNYLSEMFFLKKQIKNKNAVLVWIDKLSWRRNLPTEEELKTELDLKIIEKYNDGTIYALPD